MILVMVAGVPRQGLTGLEGHPAVEIGHHPEDHPVAEIGHHLGAVEVATPEAAVAMQTGSGTWVSMTASSTSSSASDRISETSRGRSPGCRP